MKEIFKNKKFITISVVMLTLVLILGGTYAWYVWSSGDANKTVINASMGSATVLFDGGADLTGQNLKPVINKEDGIVKTITVQTKNDTLNNISFNLYLDLVTIADELKSTDFKYELYEGATLVTSGNFEEATTEECKVNSTEETPVNHIVLVNNKTISTTLSTYTLYIWIDGTVDNDPSMAGKDFHFVLHADGQNAAFVEEPETIIEHITNLYTSGNPTLITQKTSGDSYYYSYQDDTNTWGLMNDGLKVDNTLDATTTSLAVSVTDTTALTTGTEGNIRYFGPSASVNNYIYFNCDDYSNQSDSTCELWRIIGIVDGKVKIIRDESIGDLLWDAYDNGDYTNNWSTSTLNAYLNGDYYNSLNTKNNKIAGLISESISYLGGYKTVVGLYPNDLYNYERQNVVGTTIYGDNPFTEETNIGIMHASDYGYGTDLSKCSQDMNNYNKCSANNWLFFNDGDQWLISPYPDDFAAVWLLNGFGVVTTAGGSVTSSAGVRPALYLESMLSFSNVGDGSSGNPYQIYVEPPEPSPLSAFNAN